MTIVAALTQLANQCQHKTHTHVLRGSTQFTDADGDTKTCARTQLAGEYPPKLCSKWVRLLRRAAPHDARSHGSDVCCSQFEQDLRASVRRAMGRASAGWQRSGEQLDPHVSHFADSVPDFLDTITFGQHSKAEEAQRSLRRKRHRMQWSDFQRCGWQSIC